MSILHNSLLLEILWNCWIQTDYLVLPPLVTHRLTCKYYSIVKHPPGNQFSSSLRVDFNILGIVNVELNRYIKKKFLHSHHNIATATSAITLQLLFPRQNTYDIMIVTEINYILLSYWTCCQISTFLYAYSRRVFTYYSLRDYMYFFPLDETNRRMLLLCDALKESFHCHLFYEGLFSLSFRLSWASLINLCWRRYWHGSENTLIQTEDTQLYRQVNAKTDRGSYMKMHHIHQS